MNTYTIIIIAYFIFIVLISLTEIIAQAGLSLETYTRPDSKPFKIHQRENLPSLLDKIETFTASYRAILQKPVSIILSGSAGEGVQVAAELFVKAAMKCGLHVTKKGSYPVTVGTGFSAAEIILSPVLSYAINVIKIETSGDGYK